MIIIANIIMFFTILLFIISLYVQLTFMLVFRKHWEKIPNRWFMNIAWLILIIFVMIMALIEINTQWTIM